MTLSGNLLAFSRVVRAGESNQSDEAYSLMYGGARFQSFADHPRQAFHSPWGWTSAAGAYQAMCAVPGKVKTDTWGDFIRSQGPHDFSPASQDEFFVWCVKRRHALEDIEAGRFHEALKKLNREWASLPGSPYGQPTRNTAQALAVYRAYGGQLAADMEAEGPATVPAPLPEEPTWRAPAGEADVIMPEAQPAPQEKTLPIPAIIGVLGGALIDIFSPLLKEKINKEIGRHTDNPEVGEQIANAAVEAAKAVTKLEDPLAAVAAAKADPALVQKVEQSVQDELMKLAPVFDKLFEIERVQRADYEASMAAASSRAAGSGLPDQDKFLTRSIVWMVAILLGVTAVMIGLFAYLDQETAALVSFFTTAAAIVVGQFQGRYANRYGSSAGSAAKDVVIQQMQRKL